MACFVKGLGCSDAALRAGPCLSLLQTCVSEVQDKTALQQTMEEVKLAGLSCLTRKVSQPPLAYGEKDQGRVSYPISPQKTAGHIRPHDT